MKLARTLKTLNESLNRDRDQISKGHLLHGSYGIMACKESIKWDVEYLHKTLEEIYVEQITLCLTNPFHNTLMIIACEQLMEESK